MASPTLAQLCATPTGATDADRNGAIITVAQYIGLPGTRGALSDTNHPFVSNTITNELLDGDPYGDRTGTDRLILDWFPITAVSDITDFDGTSYGYVLNTDYIIEDILTGGRAKWQGTLRRKYGSLWPIGQMNIKVSYTAGLAASGDVPADLTEAIRLVTLEISQNPTRLKSVSVDGVAYTFGEEYISMTARHLLAPFMKYKRL